MTDMEIFIKTWDLYFSNEEFTIFNKEVSQIIEIRKCINLSNEQITNIIRNEIYWCGYERYINMGKPSEIKCISCAISEIIFEKRGIKICIETRIEGCEINSEFKVINSENVGVLIGVLGTVCRVGYRRIENIRGVFECVKCSLIIKTTIRNNIYRTGTCGVCKGRLIFLEEHIGNYCVDTQEIRIQEVAGEGTNRAYIDVELQKGLVGMVAPGDVIEIIGNIKAEKVNDAYKLKISANNIKVVKEKVNNEEVYIGNEMEKMKSELENIVELESESELDKSEELKSRNELETNKLKGDIINGGDFNLFHIISEEPNLIDILAETFYASIVGHSKIKESLILALFGGGNTIRSEIHILIIGDPGLGKSRILLAASSILAKSVYVSGNFCTAAGLTVSIIHDPGSGEYMADAGALIVSDGGICCIDEFDKIDDHTALFEVMEDQIVTVAKGGVVCSIVTHPTIIAAANPRYGHFDSDKTIRENLRFDPALLSRFDLIFLLIDNTGEKEDHDVFKKLLHGDEDCGRSDTKYSYRTLVNYVKHARTTVVPILSKRAHAKLREYYLSIRHHRHITIRCLEALRRITEAHARLELKPVAAEKHAERAIKLYDSVLVKEESFKCKKKHLEEILRDYIFIKGSFIEKDNLIEIIKQAIPRKRPEELIDILNCKGLIINIGKNKYKICL